MRLIPERMSDLVRFQFFLQSSPHALGDLLHPVRGLRVVLVQLLSNDNGVTEVREGHLDITAAAAGSFD